MSSPTHGEREQPLDVAVDPRLSRGVKAFLQRLNASGGPPLETLPPLEARAVLANAQASVPVDLSGIEESEKTINSHSAPLGWRSTYVPGGIFPTHSTPQPYYVVIA
jgi:acetyl esterase